MFSRCPDPERALFHAWLPSSVQGEGRRALRTSAHGRNGGALAGAATILLVLNGCAATKPITCASGTSPMTKFELFLGQNIGQAGRVSEDEWRRFLAEEVTPRYPDGFTVLDAAGQWRDPMGTIISEQSRNLVLIVRDPASELPKIAAIRDSYKSRFRQDAVLFVQSQICAGF
jgi:hypothetical protein